MRLIIGGTAQGKRMYVQETYGIEEKEICNAAVTEIETSQKVMVYDKLHLWVKRKLTEKEEETQKIQAKEVPKEEETINQRQEAGEILAVRLLSYIREKNPDCILICDEVGNGIVPMGEAEREYREQVGRFLILLAKEAESVERILCGISQKIK